MGIPIIIKHTTNQRTRLNVIKSVFKYTCYALDESFLELTFHTHVHRRVDWGGWFVNHILHLAIAHLTCAGISCPLLSGPLSQDKRPSDRPQSTGANAAKLLSAIEWPSAHRRHRRGRCSRFIKIVQTTHPPPQNFRKPPPLASGLSNAGHCSATLFMIRF